MKKYNDLFQIGEVAALLNISRKMILNYENCGLIEPAIVDEMSGYRYFNSFTIARMQLILELRNAGMSLPDIGKYLNGTLTAASRIEALRDQIKAMNNVIEQLEIRNRDSNAEPIIRESVMPERCCICREYVADDVDDAINAVVDTYHECLKRKQHLVSNAYHFCEFCRDLFDEDFYETENISMRICICIDAENPPSDSIKFPESKMVSVSFCGRYDKSFTAYELLKAYIREHGYKVAGYPQELYLEGNFDNDNDKNIIWIMVPIE